MNIDFDTLPLGTLVTMVDNNSIGYIVGKYNNHWGSVTFLILYTHKFTRALGVAETRRPWAWIRNVITYAK